MRQYRAEPGRTVYRYHIPVARQWPLEHRGDLWIVRAPEVQPTLPAAFDTRDLEHHTQEGWLRLNKLESMADLFRKLTPILEERSKTPSSMQLARDAGRVTIARFVRTWMLTSKALPDPQRARVVVLFPGVELGQE